MTAQLTGGVTPCFVPYSRFLTWFSLRTMVENHRYKSCSHALSSSDLLKEFRVVKFIARGSDVLSSSDLLKLEAATSLRSLASFGH